jgi:pSer/pThr/pTyr-binding forkhead associated (FHA) protein
MAESGAGIGRDPGNHVQLPLPEVSKQHAFLQRTSKGWCIRDLGSRNGLFVNGRRVQEAPVQDGDRLMIGPYTLVFEIADVDSPCRPLLQLDMSDNAALQTIPAPRSKPG